MDTAISRVFLRDGWLAVEGHHEVWSVPFPFGSQPAKRLAESFDCVPDLHDRRGVWVEEGESGHYVLVDGSDGAVHREVSFGPGTRLDSVTPAGFVVRRDCHLVLVSDGAADRPLGQGSVVGAFRSTLIVDRPPGGGIVIHDLGSGDEIPVSDPGIGRWQRSPAFSPDGKRFVIGADRDAPRPLPEGFDWAAPYQAQPAQLVCVDVQTGTATIVEGTFDNFAWEPVWTADGAWVVFGAPFEKRQLWVMSSVELVLRNVKFRRNPPMPLLDVTSLLAEDTKGTRS